MSDMVGYQPPEEEVEREEAQWYADLRSARVRRHYLRLYLEHMHLFWWEYAP